MPDVFRFPARQGQPSTFVARRRLTTGELITKAALSAITYKIYDLRVSPAASIATGTIDIATCVFDSLQADPIVWPIDQTGYNFLWVSPQASFPNAVNGQAYLVEIVFTEATGGLKTSLSFLSSEVTPVQSAPL